MKTTYPFLLGLLLLAAPTAQAQFDYETNAGTITITAYTGNSGTVIIPATISGLPVTIIGGGAFRSASNLTSVTILGSVTTIEDSAFKYCTNLTSVTIPNSVTSLGDYTFEGCTSLSNVTIGNSVTSIGQAEFEDCYSLRSITIGNGVTTIGEGAFDDCTSLTNVTIPNSVASIEQNAFGNCGLTSVTIPDSVTSIAGGEFSENSVGDGAFEGCTNLAGVTIGNNVSSIGDSTFAGCSSLTNVTIPNSVTSIGAGAFYQCSSLNMVTIPNSVGSIGDEAFEDCTSLSSITIGNSVTTIGNYAFAGTSLNSVVFPNSVTSIGEGAFSDVGLPYFEGNAPNGYVDAFGEYVTVYYLPGTTGWITNFPDFPAVELNFIICTANPTIGLVPLTVNFTAPGVDSVGNTISRWNWTFGDGSTSTAQNPSHTYTNRGPFSVALMATNNIGDTLTGVGVDAIEATNAPVYSGLVLNGGFETGDFTGWTLSGNAFYTSSVDDGSTIKPYSGNYAAVLGTGGSLGYLSQTLSTTAGASYLVSFWIENSCYGDTGEFLVSWNQNTLLDTTNLENCNWTNIQFVVSATGASTILQFGFQGYYFYLDDVSVVSTQPGIASFSLSGTNLVLTAINGLSGGTYYLLMSTNLALPLNEWTHVATNVLSASGNFTITATTTVTPSVPQRFYILETQ